MWIGQPAAAAESWRDAPARSREPCARCPCAAAGLTDGACQTRTQTQTQTQSQSLTQSHPALAQRRAPGVSRGTAREIMTTQQPHGSQQARPPAHTSTAAQQVSS